MMMQLLFPYPYYYFLFFCCRYRSPDHRIVVLFLCCWKIHYRLVFFDHHFYYIIFVLLSWRKVDVFLMILVVLAGFCFWIASLAICFKRRLNIGRIVNTNQEITKSKNASKTLKKKIDYIYTCQKCILNNSN